MGGFKSAIRQVKNWQLCLILVPVIFITATLMRFNHLQMNDLKEAVLAADEAGDTEAIEAKLAELREYALSHVVINVVEKNGTQRITFGTGPFYLEQSYIRDATVALQAAEDALTDENPNGNVFAAAMAVCKPQAIANGWAWNSEGYLNCMTGEINKYPAEQTVTYTAQIPATALYRYDFVSPVWNFSLVGVMMLVCLLLTVVIIIRFVIWVVLQIAVRLLR